MSTDDQKVMVARYVEIRALARAEGRAETPDEQAELSGIQERLGMAPEQIYAAFAAAYPSGT